MIVLSLNQLFSLVQPPQRLAALDLGDKTMGVALSDTRLRIATPLHTIMRKKTSWDISQLFQLLDQHAAMGLIVGMPYNMNGTEGERCQLTRRFVDHVLKARDMPLGLWDERLSTRSAMAGFQQAGLSFKKKEKLVDKVAAALILQSALDYRQYAVASPPLS